MNEVMRDCVL